MDYAKLSDEELQKIASGGGHDYSSMSDEELEQIANPKQPGVGATALRHGLQGATAGFMDEILGAGEAAGRIAGIHGLGGPMKDMSFDWGSRTIDPDELSAAYSEARDRERNSLKAEAKANPGTAFVSNLAGSVVSPANKLVQGASLARSGAALGGLNALGASEGDNLGDVAIDTALGAGLGYGVGKGIEKASPLIGKATDYVSQKLGQKAEKLAENATGATGLQASKFDDDAGRQLLDRGLVKFGDTPEKVAERTRQALGEATGNIDKALSSLDQKGVTASADSVIADLQNKIAALEKDPSQAGVVRKLKSIVDDIYQSGESNVPIGAAEVTKRGFNKMAGNWMDPEVGQAGKQAYLSYMNEVENAANHADPALASMFKEGKETYGLLAPIEEAASRRAATVKQSPFGGLGDVAAVGAGGASGGPAGAALGLLGKKFVAPRVTSSAAVTADKISQLLAKSPQFASLAEKNPNAISALASKLEGQLPSMKAADNESKPYDSNALIQKTQGTKYSQVLQNAAQRGDQAFAATHFILQSKDPEYRRATQDEESE